MQNPGHPSIENGTHGTEKLLLKTQVSEVDLISYIRHIAAITTVSGLYR